MARKRLTRFNVIGAFEDLERAVTAVETIRDRTQVTDDELSLMGREHTMRPGTGEVIRSSTRTSGGVGKALRRGMGAGAVGGGALGVLAGAAFTAIPGVGLALGAGALYAGVAGATMGHIAGGLLGVEAGGRKSMMWAQSLSPMIGEVEEKGHVLVGVHSDDPRLVDDVQEILDELDTTLSVQRLDADESFGAPGDIPAVAGRSVPSTNPDHPGGELGMDRASQEAPKVGMAERGRDEEPARSDDHDPEDT